MWGAYIDPSTRGKPMHQEGTNRMEREVNDFHSERMNSPLQTSSLKYWDQASLRYPIVPQAARKYLCIPASNATSERCFSKAGHIVRVRRARLSDEHVKELSFCLGTRTRCIRGQIFKICKETKLFGLWRICTKMC